MSYYYGSYQQETHHQPSLPQDPAFQYESDSNSESWDSDCSTLFGSRGSSPDTVTGTLPSNSILFQPLTGTGTNVFGGPSPNRRQDHFVDNDPTPRLTASQAQPYVLYSTPTQRTNFIKGSDCDWSTLRPGVAHTLIPLPPFPPLYEGAQGIATRRDRVMYLPRRSEFSGKHKISIDFRVDGMPGPRLVDLVNRFVALDGHDDEVFRKSGWRITKFQIDWPGITIPPEELYVVNDGLFHLNRIRLAVTLAERIIGLITKTQMGRPLPMNQSQKLTEATIYWGITQVDYHRLRLISLNFYDPVWVPVLALNVLDSDM